MENNKGLITQLGETLDRYRLEKEVSDAHKIQNGQENRFRQLLLWFIPNGGTILLMAILIATQSVWAQNRVISTNSSTTTISYQGRLLDSNGLPVNDPGLGITFRLYDTDTGGSPLWSEDHIGVPVQDGLFHVLLGSMDPIPLSLLSASGSLWLGVQVGSDNEMAPREQVASVPYAMIAGSVLNEAITTEKIADQAVTQAKLGPDVNLLPPPESITTTMLADGAVTELKLAPDALTLELSEVVANVQTVVGDTEVSVAATDYVDATSIMINNQEPSVLRVNFQGTVWKTGGTGRSALGVRIDGAANSNPNNSSLIQAGMPASNGFSLLSDQFANTYFFNVNPGIHTVTLVLGSWDSGVSHLRAYSMSVETLKQP